MTLRERLQAAIADQQAEIVRIKADAITNESAAKDRLALLQSALQALTPQNEALIEGLVKAGIKVIE